jgi:3-oxoacyl-[acyl-carrier-protein] synthase II
VKAIELGIIPPTINYETPDPDCDLNYTPNKAVKKEGLRVAISDNLGFGGHNGVVVFKKLA